MKFPAVRQLTILLLMASLSGNAFAEDLGLFLGLGLGSSQYQLNEANIIADYGSLSNASRFNDEPTSFSFFGGWRLDELMALELDFLMAGDITAREAGRQFKLFDVSTLALTLAISTAIGERTRIFGRLGVHMWDLTVGGDLDSINSAVDPTYGLGADINLYGDRSRQLRVQWNHYEFDGTYVDDSSALSLGILFAF